MFLGKRKQKKGDGMRKGKIENTVKKNQYELYSFSLPLSVVNFKNRRKLVEQQLEKNHPGFSASFFTYAKYRIKNRKLLARVAVIDSKILSECRSNSSSGRLELEGEKFKISVSKKRMKSRFVTCAAILIFVSGFLLFKNTYFLREKSWNAETSQLYSLSDKEKPMFSSIYPDVMETAEQILGRVYENSGTVSAFNWNGEKCSFSINGCHPETVVFDRPCSVSYKNRSPSFSVSVDCSFGTKDCLEGALESSEFIRGFRERLENYGALLQTELCSQEKIEFRYFTGEENFKRLLKMTCDYLNLSFWHETSLCVESAASGILVSASFEKGIVSGSAVSEIIADYASLFNAPSSLELKKTPVREKTVKTVQGGHPEKLGEIRKGNEIFIYWKSKDGKIITEKVSI